MTALAIAGPLAAAVLIVVLRRGAAALALLGAGVGSLGAVVSLTGVAAGARYAAELPGLPGLPLRLVAEPLTAALATVVAVVSALVLLYAVGYVGEERDKARFYAGMSFFSAAMQTLVLAGDWVVLLASWELIGLSSYLLIGFWYGREGVPQAATRAFLYTRTADLGLYVGIFVLITQTGTSEISATLEVGGAAATLVGLLFLVAAAGKSAQTPLQGWLQDAMVGPTPVSALLHSATLVAAGAILMIRVSPLLPQEVLLAVGLVGGLTALVAGLIAVSQRDLKRLLAASTSSQYGFMLLAVGAGSPVAALIHLVAHAAIKSSLFLGSGVFQHARGSTEFTELEGVGRARRWTFLGFAVAGLALAGVPPLSGFFSKDAILAASLESPYAPVLAPLAFAGTLLTATYIALALRLLWRGDDRTEPVAGIGWMGAGLAALVGLAATLGPALPPLARFVGAGLQEGIGLGAVSGALLALCGLALGWFVPAGRLLGPLRRPAEMGFCIDGGFDGLVARPALATARGFDLFDRGIHAAVLGIGRAGLVAAHASRLVDERSIDGLIGALVRGTRELGGRARKLQSGLVHRELMIAVAGVALIFALLVIGP
jgi:NADH-quinone oxidoreductase subunit L